MSEASQATRPSRDESFVSHIEKLIQGEEGFNRAARAALRGGVGKRPGEAPRMLPYIVRFLPDNLDRGAEVEIYFLAASLMASHAMPGGEGDLGLSLRKAVAAKHLEDGVARRLAAALDAHPEDLPRHLVGLVGLCESARVPINWRRFVRDVRDLMRNDDRSAQARIRIARSFYRGSEEAPETP